MSAPEVAVHNTIVRALGEGWRESDGPLALVIFDSLINFIQELSRLPGGRGAQPGVRAGPGDLDGIDTEFGVRGSPPRNTSTPTRDLLLWDVTGKP